MKNYDDYLLAKDYIKNNDNKKAFEIMEKLYNEENDIVINYEYAKLLLENPSTSFNGLEIMKKLANNKDGIYAILELARYEEMKGNYSLSIQYYKELFNTKLQDRALLELIKIECNNGNHNDALIYYYYDMFSEENINVKLFADYAILGYRIRNKEYIEAKELIKKLEKTDVVNKKDLDNTVFYIKYKLHELTEDDYKDIHYYKSQQLNYNEENARNHMLSHFEDYSHKRYHSRFNEQVDTNKLFDIAKERIIDMKPIHSYLNDIYYVEFENIIGTSKNIETNRVEVVTLADTKDIITIYPTLLLKENIKKEKVKCKSQIDKFNERYKKI